jgi:2-polyprenyl-6-methoxyphenol hydroxylase-like FAD-dependent oxidoreductase
VSTRRVLISGAGVAGPALAHWLARHGHATTIVERFDRVRDAGQNIDVRGTAREVLRRMDLEDAVRTAGTGELGTQFVGDRGEVLASFAAGAGGVDGPTAELEILRGELGRLLYERTRDTAEYVFGDEITALDERADGVTVTFRHAEPRTFDLVVVAEGLGSRTRDLVFPDAEIRPVDLLMAYLTVPRTPADTDHWRIFQASRGRAVTLRPDNLGTIRATLSVRTEIRGVEELDRDAQVRLLRRTFAGAGWETDRVLAALDAAPLYVDAVGQVRVPTWHRGRVALLGDAAHCPSPITGMGTSLALVGAYVLAGELAGHADHEQAFAAYDARMRPWVERAQQLPPGAPGIVHPRTRLGVRALRTAVGVAGSAPVKRLAGLVGGAFASPPADEFALPRYRDEARPAA